MVRASAMQIYQTTTQGHGDSKQQELEGCNWMQLVGIGMHYSTL